MANPNGWIDTIKAPAGQPAGIDPGEAVLRAYATPSVDPGNTLVLANDALPYSSANDRAAESMALPINPPWVAMGAYYIVGGPSRDEKVYSLINVYPNAATNPVFPGNNSPDGYPVGFAGRPPAVKTNIDANGKSWEVVPDSSHTPAPGNKQRMTFDLRDPSDPSSGYGDYTMGSHRLARWGRLVTLSVNARNTAWTKVEADAISAPETYQEWVVSSGIPAGWQPRHPLKKILRGPGSASTSGTFMYVVVEGSELRVRFMKQPRLIEHLEYDAGTRMMKADGIPVLPVPAVGSQGPTGRSSLSDCFIAAYRGEDTDVCPVGPLVYATNLDGMSLQYGSYYLATNLKWTGRLPSPYLSGSGADPSELWTQINLNLFFNAPDAKSPGQQRPSRHQLGAVGNVLGSVGNANAALASSGIYDRPYWQIESGSGDGQDYSSRAYWAPLNDVYPDTWTYLSFNISWLC